MPKLAKKTKKKDTATMPSLYSLPPLAEMPREMAMMIQHIEQAAAETIMTCPNVKLCITHSSEEPTFRRPYLSITK